MQKLSAVALRKLTSHPSMILIGVALVMLIVLSGAALAQEEEVPAPYAGLENPFPWDDTSVQEAGGVIFQGSCAVCHIAKEDIPLLGIDFSVVNYRQSLEERPDFYFWTVSEGRVDTLMPPWASSLSEEERWQALTYIWSLGSEEPTPTPTSTPTPTPLPTGDPATGRDIFTGSMILENGGAACISCHNVDGIAALGGGAMAKDLTEAYSNFGAAGLTAVLKAQPFPLMNAIYEDRPLDDAEVADVVAFLGETAGVQQPTAGQSRLAFIVIGIIGGLLIVAILQIVWRGRLSGVRQTLVRGGSK